MLGSQCSRAYCWMHTTTGLIHPVRYSRLSSTSTGSAPPQSVAHVHEVTPRDGIQNETVVLSLEQRLELVRLLVDMSPSSVEVASFVRGDLVPAMAHSAELVQQIQAAPWAHKAKAAGMDFAALVPNAKGFDNFRQVRTGPVSSEEFTSEQQDSITYSYVKTYTGCEEFGNRPNRC